MKKIPRKKWLWKLLNLIRNDRCLSYSPHYFWTREENILHLAEEIGKDLNSWKVKIKVPRYAYFCERIPEYSWVTSRITALPKGGMALDVGCVMNTEIMLDILLQKYQEMHFLNLVSEPLARHGRISYHSQDIRKCTLLPHSYDLITSISTLEHVGGDNSYNEFSPNGTAEITKAVMQPDWEKGLKSCLNLLAPTGTMLVSLPFDRGQWKEGAYQLSYNDLTKIDQICAEAGKEVKVMLMGNSPQGWIEFQDRIEFDRYSFSNAPGANRVLLIEIH